MVLALMSGGLAIGQPVSVGPVEASIGALLLFVQILRHVVLEATAVDLRLDRDPVAGLAIRIGE